MPTSHVPPTSRLLQLRHTPRGGTLRITATADSTRNTCFAIENTELPAGGGGGEGGCGPPLHCHTREDEPFHIIEGQLTLFVNGKTLTLPTGGPSPDDHLIHQIMTLAPQFGLQVLGPSPL